MDETSGIEDLFFYLLMTAIALVPPLIFGDINQQVAPKNKKRDKFKRFLIILVADFILLSGIAYASAQFYGFEFSWLNYLYSIDYYAVYLLIFSFILSVLNPLRFINFLSKVPITNIFEGIGYGVSVFFFLFIMIFFVKFITVTPKVLEFWILDKTIPFAQFFNQPVDVNFIVPITSSLRLSGIIMRLFITLENMGMGKYVATVSTTIISITSFLANIYGTIEFLKWLSSKFKHTEKSSK